MIRQAAQRFLDDLKRAKKKDCAFIFDPWHASDPCDFIEKLHHVEGKWEKPTIVMHPSHIFFVVQLFGFRKRQWVYTEGWGDDGKFHPRRFTSALFAVARKNAKSTLSSAILLYCECCEPEEGAQIVSAATTFGQAAIIFNAAKRMTEKNADLREHFGLEVWAKSISRVQTGASFKPIHAKASTQDGLNPSHVGLDEIHAHKTADLLNVLQSAAGARGNPLWLFTTTEGYTNPGPWAEIRMFAKKLLAGLFGTTADHYLVVFYAVDDEDKRLGIKADDEFDEAAWIKANPLMDVNPHLMAAIRKEAIEAKQMPSKMAEFRIKRLNRPASTADGWVDLNRWQQCDGEVDLDWLEQYPGVKWQFRSGELHQERLEGVTESSNEIQVGQELRTSAPWVYSINNPVIDAVRVRFSWPVLQAQDSASNIGGVHIDYAIDVATDGGPYQQALVSSVERKNVTKYERSHRLDLPDGARWTIRARRITPEANSSLVQDAMVVEAIAEVVDSDQEYPLTSVGCIEYDAQQFGGDFPKIAVLMRGRIVRVPMNYDPATRTYATSGAGTTNGVWDGSFKEAYTNNPAWVFYDLALHPYYGLGDRIDASMINRWSLYRIAQWCDQQVPDGKGGQEPRFTCNLYLQKQAEAWAVLQDLAAIFHGLAYWDGSQIAVNADMPQDLAYTYTTSQILGDGVVKYTGSKWRDRHSLAMVSFDDPDQGFETDKEPVFDEDAMAEYGVRDVSVEAVGCTSRGQAQRAGKWALLTEQLQIRGATINVGLDGYIPKPGTVIALSDPMLAGRANGGRIAAATGRVVTLDRDVEVPAGSRLLVNLPSGKAELRQVRSVSGRQITVMADY